MQEHKTPLQKRDERIGQPLLVPITIFFVTSGNLDFKKIRDKVHEHSKRFG